MVKTRSATQRETQMECEKKQGQPLQAMQNIDEPENPKPQSHRTASKKSSSSSIRARRKKLELEAAEAKARIQMELIEKRLQADLAELDDESRMPSELEDESAVSDVARWVQRSQTELEAQHVPEHGQNQDTLCSPAAAVAGTDGPIRELTSALRDLITTSVTNNQNANLLSRISTPRDLPIFYGEPMEWLQFKQAFEESTRVCNFTEIENMWRLRRCLRGHAKDSVTALLMSGSSPEIVMATLELQFGNPDVILTKIILEIKKLHPLSPEYHKDIITFSIKIKNYVAAVRALWREEYLHGISLVSVVLSKLPTVLMPKWTDYSYPLIQKGAKSKLEILADFLHEEAVKVSTCSASLMQVRSVDRRRNFEQSVYQPQTVLVQSAHSNGLDKCQYCRLSKHKITDCRKFLRALRKDRWLHVKRFGLCYKCLSSQHDRETCSAAACNVEGCGESHHRLLHYVPPRNSCLNNSKQVQMVDCDVQTESGETVTHINTSKCEVLLKVVPISVQGPNGVINTTALLDGGSTVSLIGASLAEGAGLSGRWESLRVRGAWDNTELVCDTQMINLSICNKDGATFTLCARSIKDLNLPTQNLNIVNCENYKHLQHIKEHFCNENLKPEIIIGQDNCHLLLPLEVITGSPHEPCATRTPLGWCLHGRVFTQMTSPRSQQHSSLHIFHNDEKYVALEDNVILQKPKEDVRRFFCDDSMGVSANPRQNSEDVIAQENLERTFNFIDGQWYDGLTWKNEHHVKVNSYPNAVSRERGIELNRKKIGEYQPSETIIKEHRIKAARRTFWSDSTTVLHWIKNDTRNYKTYIAHRLGEIDELTQKDDWRYVPTDLNVADLATRETYETLPLPAEWTNGPSFLQLNENEWPQEIAHTGIDKKILECVSIIQTTEKCLPVPQCTRFSSWLRLLRATYVMLKFINKCKRILEDDDVTMDKAERLLLRHSQARTFPEEIMKLGKGEKLSNTSRLLTLTPYFDEHGIIRLSGRIDAADDVTPETKRPIILDGKDYITRLLVKYYHTRAAHGNQETIVNNLKQKYWIIKIRPTIKNVTSQCMYCRIKRAKQENPRMGDLPMARVSHHQRPFTFCGVDLFGPMAVTVGRRQEKRYGVLFTCLTVRAIHLEVVSTLTTDSFIMALRRMAARRGWPQQLFSDNGTNLKGADAEMKKSIEELDEEVLKTESMKNGTKWTFIPPASPHWGGAWERLIRSVKTCLKVVLKERAPRDETLNTLLAEVENMVNSRPLTHVSVESGDTETLTPNHFLVGSSSNLPHLGVFDDKDLHLRKQWRIAQRLADLYWRRWVREVLPDLLPRLKWCQEERPLQVGDLVLIVDPDGPRGTWPRGVIDQVLPGKDGRIRTVSVKTKNGTLLRSAARAARIPMDG